MCLWACMRLCHLVNADLGLFGPVGFVVVFETRVGVGSALAFKSPNQAGGGGDSGSVMHATCASAQNVRSP